MEIKRTLSQKQLSKEEYQKLKALNTNREDLEERLKKSTVKEGDDKNFQAITSGRSRSEARLSTWRSGEKTKAVIHISN